MRSRRSSRDSRPASALDDGDEPESPLLEPVSESCVGGAPQQKSREKFNSLSPSSLEETGWAAAPPHSRESTDAPIAATAAPQEPPLDKERMEDIRNYRRPRLRSSWACAWATLAVTLLSGLALWSIVSSFQGRQCDVKGCKLTYGYPNYLHLKEFDTEHTRFASKYGLYLYREGDIDNAYPPRGVPVLFIPGNAGSYKQARSIAGESARYFRDLANNDPSILKAGMRNLDFFTVDFNEDITAFHGQTLLDQAEYLNEAVNYILSLYHDARKATMDSDLMDPSSVIILGHSMGGVVARTMLVMPNYQSNSVNTIITMSTPHSTPPVSFDRQMVDTYDDINYYWRRSFSEKWANNNPLWHVTLVSIAGGGRDTVVPSDYASISSLVPDTHGFTVFTSSIPKVWVGMDHLEITWCNQFVKVLAAAMHDIVDVSRPGQTKPRAERMRLLKKWFLPGMEDIAEKSLPHAEPTTLLTLEDNSHSIINLGERLVLHHLGESQKPRAYLMPVPPTGGPGNVKFTLLTDQNIAAGRDGKLEILFCSVFPLQAGQSAQLFSMNMDLSGDSSGSTRLACKNAANDVILLPASTMRSKQPFDDEAPFSYLEYNFEDIAEHQFVAIVDTATTKSPGWVVAEFNERKDSQMRSNVSLGGLLTHSVRATLPADRSLVMDLHIPVIHSSLFAYKLSVGPQTCGEGAQLFTPLVRQYLTDPYESKYFVNVHTADINIHGTAPFVPPALWGNKRKGLSLQIWTDPTCNSPVDLSISIDLLGSLGRLGVRYRTVLAAFPLLVVAMVIRTQFREYDASGHFMSFGEGLDLFVAQSLPWVLASMSIASLILSIVMSRTSVPSPLTDKKDISHAAPLEFTKNDMLVGLQDPVFWFIAPAFALFAVGICACLNYAAMILLHSLTALYSTLIKWPNWISNERRRAGGIPFSTSSPGKRIVTTAALLFFVATLVPYQFAYLVACFVQIATCIKALKFARENVNGDRSWDFYHYAHSVLIMMLWILPINLPVLVVWSHNLAVHWLTPFSSHHNLLSITPFVLLVETLTTGTMIPRVTNHWLQHATGLLLLGTAAYAALYGVIYAYRLHHLVNIVAAWFVVIHHSGSRPTIAGMIEMITDYGEDGAAEKRHQ